MFIYSMDFNAVLICLYAFNILIYNLWVINFICFYCCSKLSKNCKQFNKFKTSIDVIYDIEFVELVETKKKFKNI